MLITLGTNCVVTDIVATVQCSVSPFNYLGIYSLPKFCPLLLTNGSDWFGENATTKVVGSMMSVRCNKYYTRALHDIGGQTPEDVALKLVTERRRGKYKQYLSDLESSDDITFIRCNFDDTPESDNHLLYNTLTELMGRKPFTLILAQKGLSSGERNVKCIPVSLPNWDDKKNSWNREELKALEDGILEQLNEEILVGNV